MEIQKISLLLHRIRSNIHRYRFLSVCIFFVSKIMNEKMFNHTKIVEAGNQNGICFPDRNNLLQAPGAELFPDWSVQTLWFPGRCFFWTIRQAISAINQIVKTTKQRADKRIVNLPPVRRLWFDRERISGQSVRFIPGAVRIN